jgi:exonuclease VII small subunit
MEEKREFQQRMQRVEALVHQLERAPDPRLRADAQELVRTLMDLHQAGLAKVLETIRASGDSGAALVDRLADDEVVSSVLLLHGLHPLDFDTRVRRAIKGLGGVLHKSHALVEIVAIRDGVISLRLFSTASPGTCGSSLAAARQRVEDAVYQAAPDLAGLEIEQPMESPAPVSFVPLEKLTRRKEKPSEHAEGPPV